ncbi:MAG: hypothetical protein JW702_09110 [Clostridiales bacterium]|nr:hypothetical protein [Clostridiales bacterium]
MGVKKEMLSEFGEKLLKAVDRDTLPKGRISLYEAVKPGLVIAINHALTDVVRAIRITEKTDPQLQSYLVGKTDKDLRHLLLRICGDLEVDNEGNIY